MLSHCCLPTSFCMTTMIPIPKGSGSMGDMKNYSGIALSSLLSKLFDTCIIFSQFDSLLSNDLQFAYKSQTSTIQCIYSVIETVMKDSYQRDMCTLFLRFIMSTYQQMRVKCNGTTSNTFSTSNGVKQGGVISLILFNVYINELILLLSEQGVGCHLHGQFVSAFIYTDDVTLLAPTSTALNAMLEICSNFAIDFDLQFTAVKLNVCIFRRTTLQQG